MRVDKEGGYAVFPPIGPFVVRMPTMNFKLKIRQERKESKYGMATHSDRRGRGRILCSADDQLFVYWE